MYANKKKLIRVHFSANYFLKLKISKNYLAFP